MISFIFIEESLATSASWKLKFISIHATEKPASRTAFFNFSGETNAGLLN